MFAGAALDISGEAEAEDGCFEAADEEAVAAAVVEAKVCINDSLAAAIFSEETNDGAFWSCLEKNADTFVATSAVDAIVGNVVDLVLEEDEVVVVADTGLLVMLSELVFFGSFDGVIGFLLLVLSLTSVVLVVESPLLLPPPVFGSSF